MENQTEEFGAGPKRSGADGISAVQQSLLNVLKTRKTDVMPVIRYDVRPRRGPFEARYWAITNVPILGGDEYVQWILYSTYADAEDAAWREIGHPSFDVVALFPEPVPTAPAAPPAPVVPPTPVLPQAPAVSPAPAVPPATLPSALRRSSS